MPTKQTHKKVLGTPPPIVKIPKTPDYTPPKTPLFLYKKPDDEKPDDETPVNETPVKADKKKSSKLKKVPEEDVEIMLGEIQEKKETKIEDFKDSLQAIAKCLGLSTSR